MGYKLISDLLTESDPARVIVHVWFGSTVAPLGLWARRVYGPWAYAHGYMLAPRWGWSWSHSVLIVDSMNGDSHTCRIVVSDAVEMIDHELESMAKFCRPFGAMGSQGLWSMGLRPWLHDCAPLGLWIRRV